MENAQNSLQKRLYFDTLCTYIMTAGIAIVAFAKLLTFIAAVDASKIAGENYKGTAPGLILSDVVFFAFLAVTIFVFSLVLKEVHRTGRPFSEKIINRLRVMAFMLILASVVPEAAAMVFGFFDSNAAYGVFRLDSINLGIIAFGVVVGLISEIFKYGYELQENMDSIA